MALKLFAAKAKTPDAGTETSTIIENAQPQPQPTPATQAATAPSGRGLRGLGALFVVFAAVSAGLLVFQAREANLTALQVGAASATTRAARGLSVSVMRLIAPPFPAASRPSKLTTTLRSWARMYSCCLTNSTCSRASSAS